MTGIDTVTAVADFRTVRDFIRHAVSQFNAADLSYGHGTASAWDEAVFMVLEALRLPVDQLEPYLDARLATPERTRLASLIETRVKTRKPASYLLNRAYIQGFPFYVDERVIVPRSYIGEILFSGIFSGEGLALVDDPTEPAHVLDLCTGSGCLAILAAHVFPEADIDAVDLSPEALSVARRNVKDYAFEDRIRLFEGDLFSPLKGRRYDVILTNPPYVDASSMEVLPPEFRHEPSMALASGEDGLDLVRRILRESPHYLTEKGGILCEFGTGREILEAEYPDLDFLWIETESSFGEVFWLTRQQLLAGGHR
ncbi:50S ribosomal protein L3 N(5)-glutamine methyltransferase [Haematospirillum jordaniae]|uniref:50S ribosomal protein L3 N(5)-glutamine methyltransferase n=1 Tax=Haematospirillum jordaniae TaxID=1549855 RepID=UPI001ADEB4EA|nr:50S ribosomal protein L3 N(5)-glutamine methyltransferase [Haematospirillum jordaniae]